MTIRTRPQTSAHFSLAMRGFTLIELLVVITIIVVLLALLTPALDKAIYQAELAVCAANQKALSSGVLTYVMDNRRAYPYRSGVHRNSGANNDFYPPYTLAHEANGNQDDDRPELRPYMSITKVFSDPLTESVDYGEVDENQWIWTPVDMWFGYRFITKGEGYMARLGQRLTWTDEDGVTQRYNVLASDSYSQRANLWITGHPDSDGVFQNWHVNDAQDVVGAAYVANPDHKATASYWTGQSTPGHFDMNYAFDDGSVKRLDKLTHEEWREGDSRVGRVGITQWDNNTTTTWEYVAKR